MDVSGIITNVVSLKYPLQEKAGGKRNLLVTWKEIEKTNRNYFLLAGGFLPYGNVHGGVKGL